VPAALSGLLLLVWFPLISGRVASYESATGLSADGFLARWLLITAVLFGGSALLLLVLRLRRETKASARPHHRSTSSGSSQPSPRRTKSGSRPARKASA
jgi:hypothetical protein